VLTREEPVRDDDIFEVLEQDHATIRALLDQILLEMDDEPEVARGLFAECRRELLAHAHAEGSIVYAVFEEIEALSGFVGEGREEHALVEKLIDELMWMSHVDDEWQAKLTVLSELVEHHVAQEEKDAFPKARRALSPALAADLATRFVQARRRELGPDDDSRPHHAGAASHR